MVLWLRSSNKSVASYTNRSYRSVAQHGPAQSRRNAQGRDRQMRSLPRRRPGAATPIARKSCLESRTSAERRFEWPSSDQRSIWQAEHSAGGVYRCVADGGGVSFPASISTMRLAAAIVSCWCVMMIQVMLWVYRSLCSCATIEYKNKYKELIKLNQ